MPRVVFAFALLVAFASAFAPPRARTVVVRTTSSSAVMPVAVPVSARPAALSQRAQMSLFGLGWPELLVIGGAALLFFGPDKLTDIAKEAGKSAAALKDASSAFQEGMEEAVKENKMESANPKKELNGSDKK